MIKLLIGILVLILGFPIGTYLANSAKEELRDGQRWFRIITSSCLGAGFVALVVKNDVLMFSFFFIALVTSRSLKGKK